MNIYNLNWLTGVWDIGPVNPFLTFFDVKKGSFVEGHIAPFPEELPIRIIELFSKKGDLVLDPFMGSGTTAQSALKLFRKPVGYELEEKYIDMIKRRCGYRGTYFCKSSEDMSELENESIDLCVTSPPYLHLRDYSDNPENLCNIENPYPNLKKVFFEIFRVLKKGSYFCLNVADVPIKNTPWISTFPYDMMYLCKKAGFELVHTVIWNKGIHLRDYNIKNRKIRVNHEYVWIMQKPYGGNKNGPNTNIEQCENRTTEQTTSTGISDNFERRQEMGNP